ncbi:MAG: FkbM family methyltransferase [Candidatus Micrarchaeota archaeon]
MSKIGTSLEIIRKLENWPTYFADYLGLIRSDRVRYAFRNGISLELRPASSDRYAVTDVWFNEVYTPKGFEIRPTDIVVDIGGHIGSFSVFAAKKAEEGRVFSFEPVPGNFEMLKRNLGYNRLDNVSASPKAVSGRSGKKTMYLTSHDTFSHSSIESLVPDMNGKIEADAISLEDIFKENKLDKIDFLKIDCEGSEYEILSRTPLSVFKKIHKISMEYHEFDEGHDLKTLKAYLESAGYSISAVPSKRLGMIYAKRLS